MKKDLAIVMCGTSNMMFAIGTAAINLKKTYKGSDYDLIIYHDNKIKQSDIDTINNIKKTKFIEYKFPLEKELKSKKNGVKHFTEMVFSKFECLKLLNEYKTVIYTDYDVFITGDISELEYRTISGIKGLINEKCIDNNFIEKINEYDMNGDSMIAGLIVFQDNLKDYDLLYDFCYKITEKYFNNLRFPEQVGFSLMLQEFNINPEKLNFNEYYLLPNMYPNFPNAKILHSYGFHKFWNGIKDESFNLWNVNYIEWINMGGSRYNSKNKLIYKLLLKFSWFIPVRKWRDVFRLNFM
ncbi:glycosyltransferase [Brachyspira innocens]|uniref:glycosyltransferase n=1 Tax=Brachyspira innocens TaxID=13264 RepID=UPI0026EC21CC|nr:glycosyltransferase [Brachyspira innocens]